MATRSEYGRGAEGLLDFMAGEFEPSGAGRARPDDMQFYYKMPAVLAYGGRRSGDDLLARQQPDAIDFEGEPDVPKPHIGWGCDATLTLVALDQGTA